MSILFSANLSSLRREKGISQKQAAEALGISQALLSHYEKGIRECHLDFVSKAAAYYGVTADYLLGISESRRALNDITEGYDLPDDHRMLPKTVLRCMISLAKQAEAANESAELFFTDYFSLCIQKYMTAVSQQDGVTMEGLCDASLNRLCAAAPKREEEPETPLCEQTVSDHALMLLNNDVAEAFR